MSLKKHDRLLALLFVWGVAADAAAASISLSQSTYTYITDVGYYQVVDFPYTDLTIRRDWTYRPPATTQPFSLNFNFPALPDESTLSIALLTLSLSDPFVVWNAAQTRAEPVSCALFFCPSEDADIHVSQPPEAAAFTTVSMGGLTASVVLDRFGKMDLKAAGFDDLLGEGGLLLVSGYEYFDVGNAPINVTDRGFNSRTDFSIRGSATRSVFGSLNVQYELAGSSLPGGSSDPLDAPPVPTPEPSTMLYIGSGVLLAGLNRWKRRVRFR